MAVDSFSSDVELMARCERNVEPSEFQQTLKCYPRHMPSPAKTTKRRGRRQGEPVSRDVVLAAAKRRFATEGYEKTTLRAIAKDAHVDPSMVLYLFGSKEELFRESLRLIFDPEVLVAAMTGAEDDDPDIGTRMVRMYLRIWETPDTAASMRAMLQSATSNTDANDPFRGLMQNS